MPSPTNLSPGTVSQILWHFTGGPKWNDRLKRQSRVLKPHASAFESLISILRSRELRLGNYSEICHVFLPRHPHQTKRQRVGIDENVVVDWQRRESGRIDENVVVEIRSCPVCCLADIPIGHLAYHALRDGKFAIGFYREAVVEHGFNPVFYTLRDANVIQSLYWGLYGLKLAGELLEHTGNLLGEQLRGHGELFLKCCEYFRVRYCDARTSADLSGDVASTIVDCYEQLARKLTSVGGPAPAWEDRVSSTLDLQGKVKMSLEKLVAFTKTFNRGEFSTVYCEREWRSVKAYKFRHDQVAMIVLPKVIGTTKYYDEFLKSTVREIRIPRGIAIVAWGELVEH